MSAPTQFRKKPVVISAIQWTGENLVDVIHFTDGRPPNNKSSHAGMMWDQYVDLVRVDGLKIFTMEGKMDASIGDWIIKGVKGEHYPCKPEIFALTYEDASAGTDLSQAAVAAALEAAAKEHDAEIVRLEAQIIENNKYLRLVGKSERSSANDFCNTAIGHHRGSAVRLRDLITPAQHDALAAHVAAEARAVGVLGPDRVERLMAALRGGWKYAEQLYMQGQCMTIYQALRAIWPDAIAWYSALEGHVYTEIDGKFYDIRGKHSKLPDGAAKLDFRSGDRAHRWARRDDRTLSALHPASPLGEVTTDSFDQLIAESKAAAIRAMIKYPQPNYVISKVAEEAGEVVKAAIHCAEGRETPENVIGEMRQTIAMLYRLWVEGDQVHGLAAIAPFARKGE